MSQSTPHPYGAADVTCQTVHALARICSGLPVEFSENGMAPRWKTVAVHLSGLPLTDVAVALEAHLAAMPDVDAECLQHAIFNCDPRIPDPAGSGSDGTTTPFPVSPLYKDEKRETESAGLQTLPIRTLLEQTDAEIKWCVAGLIPAEGVAIIAAPAGYGKSWTLLDLAIECARGGRWLGRFPVRKGGVLYLDEESTPALLRHRLSKLLAGKGINSDGLEIWFGIGQGICFNDVKSFELIQQVVRKHKPSLIIIDSLIRVHRAEENSASEMARMFANVKALVRESECTVVFADHQKKPGKLGSSLDLLLRGSTEKAAFVDCLLSMQRRGDALIMEHSKSRFAEPVPPFAIRIEDPAPDTTVVTFVGDAEGMRQAARQEEATAFLLQALSGDDWLARKDLVASAKTAGVAPRLVDGTLRAMVAAGQVNRDDRKPETGKGGKQAFYKLAKPETEDTVQLELGEDE